MADDTPPPPPPAGDDANNAPHIASLAQYIKDLSVENPNSPAVFQWKTQPRVDVNFNIGVNAVADGVREVVLKVEASAKSDEGVHFVVDLTYCGLYGFQNITEDQLHAWFHVDAPGFLFPFARRIIADAIGDAGFPPLMIDGIDFRRAYVEQIQAQQGGTNGGTPAETAPTADA
ncbi:MAG: protein-export chaperone SecB [Sphingomonas sp.]|nr:protein-export chaperone SecB [Sphingomonas sp.]RZV48906.1 MAG: protein-export chaperone SecB [Sphingomonadaceae bacterium]